MEDNEKYKTTFPKKTLLLIVFLIIVALGLSTVAIYINSAPQFPAPTPTPIIISADTILSISQSPIKTASSSAYKISVLINTGKNRVTKTQLELSYNPLLLNNVDILPGQFFQNGQVLLKNIDTQNGRISFAIEQSSDQNGVTGNGVLAVINFLINNYKAPIYINFEPKTQVSADSYSESVLKTTVNGILDFTSLLKATSSGK
jgi:hypothetical protein